MNKLERLTLLLVLAALMAVFPTVSHAQGWGEGPVVVYEDRDGRGRASSFGIGVYRNDRGEFGTLRNDTASSVSVPPGFRVRFCAGEGRNGQGDGLCEEYGPGNHNLRYSDEASYIRVTGPLGTGGGWGGQRGVTVYEDRNFRGRSAQFGIGRFRSDHRQFGNLRNDRASSVVVQRGFRVRICEGEGDGFGWGRCEEYGEGRHNLQYDDVASYIEVQRSGGGWGGWPGQGPGGPVGPGWPGGPGTGPIAVILYSDRNQRGDQQAFGVGIYRADRGQMSGIGNDKASSIFVPRGLRARICEGEGRGMGGLRCEEYGAGSYNLRFNDSASWIRVWRGN